MGITMRPIRRRTIPLVTILGVLAPGAVIPDHFILFKCQQVGTDPVQEPAIVTDHQHTAGKIVNQLPEKYSNRKAVVLTADITPEKNDPVDLELTSK